jgi:hypothetical protein
MCIIFYYRYLGNDHLTWKGEGLWFFSKKKLWFPILLKKIFWFWWREKNNLIQSFCHITQCWILEKNFALWATKKINILTLVMSEKKNIPPPPPFKLNGRSLIYLSVIHFNTKNMVWCARLLWEYNLCFMNDIVIR